MCELLIIRDEMSYVHVAIVLFDQDIFTDLISVEERIVKAEL